MTKATLPDLVEGPDLLLRAWRPSDVDVLADVVTRNLEHLRPWMAWIVEEPLPREVRLTLIEGWARTREEGGDVVLGVFQGGEAVGGTGLHRRRGPRTLEIGYWVGEAHTGRGIATEAARLLTTAALGVPGTTAVEINHDKANVASSRIPARLGYALVDEAPAAVTAPGQAGIDCTWRVHAGGWRAGH